MCGISLWVSSKKIDKEDFKVFNDKVAHRGPDFSKIEIYECSNKYVALGHRRLSIIDLKNQSNQPMHYKSYVLVFNGEIYNYLELKKELEINGIIFETKSDTEVLLKSYIFWGEKCLEKFNGMFSFVIFDKDKMQLFFARDRFGIKPLYYFINNENFYFASEIKQFTSLKNFQPVGNINCIGNFINNRYLDYSEETFFKNIFQVRGGEAGFLDIKNLKFNKYRWYDISKSNDKKSESFLELFKKSIQLRLRSDVEIGSCLSGGIDSSSIVCVADKEMSKIKKKNYTIQTFTSCFKEKRYDERDFVEITKKFTSIKSHYVFPNGNSFFKDIEKIVYYQDEPFPSGSIYAQNCIFKDASMNGIKVMLDGQGADELFCGYSEIFYPTYFKSLTLLKKISEIVNSSNKKRILKFFLKEIISQNNKKNPSYIKKKYQDKFQNTFDCLKSHIDYFINYHLPALLHYEDRNSMRYSIEARLPFLDYKLVEFGYHTDDYKKIGSGIGKKIIREALKGITPDKILNNKLKKGFGTPQRKWIDENKYIIIDSIKKLFYFDIFEESELDTLLFNLKKNIFEESIVMRIYIFSVWLKVFKINKIV